jgi:hypothetical protein
MQRLPFEMLLEILGHLSLEQRLGIAPVSRLFERASHHDSYWKQLCCQQCSSTVRLKPTDRHWIWYLRHFARPKHHWDFFASDALIARAHRLAFRSWRSDSRRTQFGAHFFNVCRFIFLHRSNDRRQAMAAFCHSWWFGSNRKRHNLEQFFEESELTEIECMSTMHKKRTELLS